MKITSGFNFEDYKITDYLDFCSGECALGTGFLSSLGAGFADFFGSNSTMYSDKLKRARDFAIDQLINRAVALGADAIIGLDIDYTTFSSDIMGVIANGTAVKIKRSEEIFPTTTNINITNYNPDLDFRLTSLSILTSPEQRAISVKLSGNSIEKISAVNADVVFTTIFGDEHVIGRISFAHFDIISDSSSVSSPTPCAIPTEILPLVKSAKIFIRKYISHETIITATDNDQLWISKQENDVAKLVSKGLNIDEYMNSINFMNSATEILDYTKALNEQNNNFLNPELIDIITSSASLERIYGNCKNECMKKIKNYLNI